jgi:hypothetical protein
MEPPRAPAVKVGLPSEKVRARAVNDFNKYRSKKFEGKQGESDHRIPDRKPKWMVSGKRGNGKTDRRRGRPDRGRGRGRGRGGCSRSRVPRVQ